MTDRPTPDLSNETLNAYLDGELDGTRRHAVEHALAHDPDAAGRLAAYRRQDELLKIGLAELAVPPAGDAHAAVPRHRATSRRGTVSRRAAIAAGVALLLAAGSGGLGWLVGHHGAQTPLLSELGERAMLAHLAYVGGREAATAPSRDAVERRLRKTLGVAVAMPELSRFGLHLVAVRQAPAAQKGALLLVYAGTGGPPVSCYFAPAANGRETPFAARTIGNVGAVYRFDDGIAYAVVGARPVPNLKEIAAAGLRYPGG